MWKFFNERWNNSIIVCALIAFLCFWGFSVPNKYILYTSCFLPFIFLLVTFILSIIRIVKKDYLKGILQILSTVILAVLTYGCFSFALMFYPYDFFAEGLKIPENIKFEKPLKLNNEKTEYMFATRSLFFMTVSSRECINMICFYIRLKKEKYI